MSLPTQNWKFVGSAPFAAGYVNDALNALHVLGTAVTYLGGAARTPGSGSAWTWTQFQIAGPVTEAAYASPPAGGGAVGQRIILAGSTVGKTPSMATPDTYANNIIFGGICKTPGAFLAWDNAAPFTTGSFSGYWRLWPASVGAGSVWLWECQESVMIQISTVAGAVYSMILGAWVDPESTDTVLDAETDGRLYGWSTSGSAALMVANWLSGTSLTHSLLQHTAVASQCHCAVFTPGAAALMLATTTLTPSFAMTASGMKTRSGRFGRIVMALRKSGAASADQLLGRIREINITSDAVTGQKLVDGATTVGHLFAANTASSTNAVLLLA